MAAERECAENTIARLGVALALDDLARADGVFEIEVEELAHPRARSIQMGDFVFGLGDCRALPTSRLRRLKRERFVDHPVVAQTAIEIRIGLACSTFLKKILEKVEK